MTKPCVNCGFMERYDNGQCRPCALERARKYRTENRDRLAAEQRAYRAKNKDKIKALNQKYTTENKTKIRSNKQEYYQKNKAKISLQKRERYAKNKDRIKAQVKEYYINNKDKLAASKLEWQRANPEKVAASRHKRRAREKKAGGKLIAAEIKEIYNKYPTCLVCGADTNLALDHIVPIISGGQNAASNIQVLCKPCNSIKGTNTIDYREKRIVYSLPVT